MKRAGELNPGGMAAILGVDIPTLDKVCAEASTNGEVVQVANDNCPGQVVISEPLAETFHLAEGGTITLRLAREVAAAPGGYIFVEGESVGSVFLVKESETVSKLRLLLVHPKARGLGMGKRMVSECLRFAKQAGYRKTMLWTNNVLLAARHIYETMGFKLVLEEPHHSFGHDLVGETWELEL